MPPKPRENPARQDELPGCRSMPSKQSIKVSRLPGSAQNCAHTLASLLALLALLTLGIKAIIEWRAGDRCKPSKKRASIERGQP